MVRPNSSMKRPLETLLFGSDDDGDVEADKNEPVESPRQQAAAAWHDSDDEGLEVDITAKRRLRKLRKTEEDEVVGGLDYVERLRSHFCKLHGTSASKWAEPREQSDSDSEAELFQTSSKLVLESKGGRIAPHHLNSRRIADVTKQEKGKAVVQSVRFHPEDEIVMTCGYDKTLRLYHIDNDRNPLVGSYHFENFPISGAEFTSDGKTVVVTGLSRCVWRFDVESGQAHPVKLAGHHFERMSCVAQGQKYIGLGADNGHAAILDERTTRLAKLVKMNAETRAISFHPTKNSFYTADCEAYIYEWDIGTGRCITRFRDDAAVSCSSLAVSPDGNRLAVGTDSGIVDFFDLSGPLTPKVVKSIDNLTTTVTSLRFHPESDILAMASKYEKRALKLLHLPTYTVYANWPTAKATFGKPNSVDFSHKGGHLAVGNQDGKVLLYTLDHYI